MARAGGFFAPPARHDDQPQGAAAALPGGFIGFGGCSSAAAAAPANANANAPPLLPTPTDQGCERCGDPRPHAVSPKWLAAFGVALCTACRAADELVTKTAAKEAYLVSDHDLAPLGTLSRENPRNRQFAPMKLYLASQVAAVAARKHGGAEGLQAARAARVGSKLEARAAKRRREQARDDAAERERLRLEREAEARRAEMEGGDGVKEEDEDEDEEEEEGGAAKKKKKKMSGGGGGKKKKGGGGKGAGSTEVVVDAATGRRGRRFGEGLAVVDEAEMEEM